MELIDRELAGSQVVEIGCGPGALLAELAARHPDTQFLGIDVVEEMIVHARDHHAAENARFELADLSTDRVDVTADFAYSVDVLHHVRDLRAFLRGVTALLRRGARWVVMEPNLYHPYVHWSQARMRRAGFDEDQFRPREVEPLLADAGLAIRRRRFAFLFPGWIERVPRALAWLEPPLERVPVLGGGIVYTLERR